MTALLVGGAGCTSILGGDYRATEAAGGGAPSTGGAGGEGATGGAPIGGAGGEGHGAGAVGGAGGDAGGAAGSGGGSPCPADMAHIVAPTAEFCIDRFEVPRSDYLVFLEAGFPSQMQSGDPSVCFWNTSYTPEADWPPTSDELDLPAVNVSWCDAYAYCSWAGKRLCGRIGGGPTDPDLLGEATESEWTYTCTNGGTTPFPYGSSYDELACNVMSQGLAPVGSFPGCNGVAAPFDVVFDLSGNGQEWENGCSGGANGTCARRGGGIDNGTSLLACGNSMGARTNAWGDVTFRCCADPSRPGGNGD